VVPQRVFDDLWDQFIQQDRIGGGPHRQRTGVALIVWLRDREIVEKISQIQAAISKRVPLTPIPRDTLHITLRRFNDFKKGPKEGAESGLNKLPVLMKFLQEALRGWPRFRVRLTRVNSFQNAPFIEVYSGRAIQQFRNHIDARLQSLGLRDYDYGIQGYVPHVTLGYYDGESQDEMVRNVLLPFREGSVGETEVTRLTLTEAYWSSGRYRLRSLDRIALTPMKGEQRGSWGSWPLGKE
jgi:2'-5' RNA ligase